MTIVSQVAASVFWLAVIPLCIGLVPANFISPARRNLGVILLAGYLLMWAVFGVIAIPAVILIKYDNFLFVLRFFMAAAILLAIAGILLWYCDGRRNPARKPWLQVRNLRLADCSLETKLMWLLFLALVLFQLYMAVTRASFDGDDAYYVVQSLMAQQSGAMYKNLPYTGRSADLDVRHALAVFPMWVAFVAVKADIHATIFSHVIMPLVLIPLSYLVYYEIGKALFASRRENIPVFLVLMGMFQMFGNVSIYTNETFFLTRTWQGKSVAGSFIIPMLFLTMLWLYEEEHGWRGMGRRRETDRGLWFLLVCLNMSAGICSSIAVFLLAILLAVMAFCLMIARRDLKIPVKLGLTCIPNAIYVALYLALAR